MRCFNALGPDGLLDNWTSGLTPRLSPDQVADPARLVEAGPDREVDGVVRLRRLDLQRAIAERFGVDHHERYVRKLLKEAGLSPICGRGLATRRKTRRSSGRLKKIPARFERSPLDSLPKTPPIEIWFQHEARAGQRNGLVRQWARRGTRPRHPADQPYESAYFFGAICPPHGVPAGLALP